MDRVVWRCGGVVVAALVGVLSGCSSESVVGVQDVDTGRLSVEVQGGTRGYRLYVPPAIRGSDPSSAPTRPLLLVFHGATQSAAGIELLSWLYPAADEVGMLVAYPEASGDYWNTPNSPPAYWNVADVPFAEAVIQDVAQRYPVDPTRVFATGYSNGAIFAQVLACLRGETIAALGVVGAGISATVSQSCPWHREVPTVVFFGDADPQFFWDDGLAAGVGMLGGFGSGSWLAENNGCDSEPSIADLGRDPDTDTGVELWRYRGCVQNADVDLYRILDGGHTWPGSPINMPTSFGRKSRSLDASAAMVDFFLAHPLPDAPMLAVEPAAAPGAR